MPKTGGRLWVGHTANEGKKMHGFPVLYTLPVPNIQHTFK